MTLIPQNQAELPPSSIPSEQCAIGSLMLMNSIADRRQVVSRINPQAFYLPEHQLIWQVASELVEADKPLDAVILREELSLRKKLDEIGGSAYLADILNTVPSSANWRHYVEIVREAAARRFLITIGNRMVREAFDTSIPILAAANRFQNGITTLISKFSESEKREGGADELSGRLDGMMDGTIQNIIIPDFPQLSKLTQMLLPGSAAVLCGLPGDSKSLMVLKIMWTLLASGTSCALLNAEQNRAWLLHRLVAMLYSDWNMLDAEWIKANGELVAQRKHESAGVCEEVGRHVFQTSIRKMDKRSGAAWIDEACRNHRVVIVDPVTAFKKIPGVPIDEQDDELIGSIKTSAERHGSSVVIVAHPVKDGLGGKEYMSLGDIAGGAALQRFMDVVLFLYAWNPRRAVEIRKFGMPEQIEVNRFLHIDKARNGKGNKTWLAIDLNDKMEWKERGVMTKKK